MRYQRYLKLYLATLAGLLILTGMAPANASSANISHSYHATANVSNGDLVSLDPQRSDYVQLADTTNGARLLGVAVAANDSLLAVDPTKGSIQVATSGNATALVSNLDGDIHIGDQIAVSPFSGVGMKALDGSYTVGLAQTSFDSRSKGATTQTVTGKNGKKTQVAVGYIRLNITIGIDSTGGSQANLNSLQKLVKSLTGHTISTVRVVIGLTVATIASIALVTLIYASIYSSIISIGRNPLAKREILQTLGLVLGMAVLIAGVASLAIFLLFH